jgi:hypothetical protein
MKKVIYRGKTWEVLHECKSTEEYLRVRCVYGRTSATFKVDRYNGQVTKED